MKLSNKSRKTVAALTAAVIACAAPATLVGCTARDEVLRIYNWGDYIDEDLLPEFEEWYEEQTGKRITVQYDTFDTNEDMIMRIEVLNTDYDLVCPSDYMAERMIKEGLAQKIDRDIFDMTEDGFLYDGLAEMVRPFDPDNEYYVPYVWGTFGIMYDTDHIEAGTEDMKSWEAMWSSEYSKRILMKDSVRDAYSVASIYANRDKLSALSDSYTDYNESYQAEITKIFSEISDASIAQAQSTLIEQKKLLYKYEVDDGKNDMLAGTTEAWLGLFWTCDSCLIMQEDGGEHFYYEVPKEGSNVWVDGWIIPKYAGNVEAANYFIKFINTYDDEYDFAMRNFDYMGASMASRAVMEDAKAALLEDDGEDEDSLFFEKEDWFKPMYIDMLFPTEETLARCGVMRDFGKARSTELDSMWIDVKTS
ncbi:MAG: extracellular solute-binding protein [Clostridiales bacterium]|nr:extracellular solute-binding protein [Clostridiales bacterium]